jgi:hypothetical protein
MSLPQPVPPSWKVCSFFLFRFAQKNNSIFLQDLGKSSNDLLGKDYHFSGTSLEVKTGTPSNVTFKVDGNRDSKSSFVAGNLEAKYTDKAHGLAFTQAWSTSNALRTQIELENQIAKGLKLDTTTTLHPEKSSKSVLLGAAYKQPGLHSRAVLDVFKVCATHPLSSPWAQLLSPHRAPLLPPTPCWDVTASSSVRRLPTTSPRAVSPSTLPPSASPRLSTPSRSTVSQT